MGICVLEHFQHWANWLVGFIVVSRLFMLVSFLVLIWINCLTWPCQSVFIYELNMWWSPGMHDYSAKQKDIRTTNSNISKKTVKKMPYMPMRTPIRFTRKCCTCVVVIQSTMSLARRIQVAECRIVSLSALALAISCTLTWLLTKNHAFVHFPKENKICKKLRKLFVAQL